MTSRSAPWSKILGSRQLSTSMVPAKQGTWPQQLAHTCCREETLGLRPAMHTVPAWTLSFTTNSELQTPASSPRWAALTLQPQTLPSPRPTRQGLLCPGLAPEMQDAKFKKTWEERNCSAPPHSPHAEGGERGEMDATSLERSISSCLQKWGRRPPACPGLPVFLFVWALGLLPNRPRPSWPTRPAMKKGHPA